MSGLEEDVEFGKKLERYDVATNGDVVAYFADGTSERGRFLVGADGVRSLVRRQLLPEMVLLDTEGRAVFGKTEITDELVERMAHQIGDGIALAGESEESRMKLFTDGMRWDREQSSNFARELDIELPHDYIYWVLVFRKDIVSAEEEDSLLTLSNSQSAQMAVDLTSSWKENIRVLLDMQNPDAASTLAFLISPPDFDSKWSAKSVEVRSRITLIGDSAHPMPPVGGVGANTGFQDSADLCDALSQMATTVDERERERLIGAFEEKMLQRSKAAVERISGGAGNFFGMKPLAELKPAVIWH